MEAAVTRPPFGLGYDATVTDAIIEERGKRVTPAERAERPKTLLNDGAPTVDERQAIYDNVIDKPAQQGNSADYLTARIARDRPDILDGMKRGDYPSVRAAATDAG